MAFRLLKSILILPGNVLGTVPAVILWASAGTAFDWRLATTRETAFWAGVALAGVGLALAISTMRLFVQVGKGTPAPWDPPRHLVVEGPYRHVRNPMISGVLFGLAAEALLFHSWGLAAWLVLFFVANGIYFSLVEEKRLLARFGDPYALYKSNVPRWLPRLKPWSPPKGVDP